MIIIDKNLRKRHEANDPIRVGLIGSGEMAKGMMNQINQYTQGMVVSATYSRSLEKARKVYNDLGFTNYCIVSNLKEAYDCVLMGKSIITNDIDLLVEMDFIDVLVESTGAIEFGAEAILKAFSKGKDVLSFNAELDSTLGPILYQKSKQFGVKYALADGDQPGVIMNLYRYVKQMGFQPLVCGNIKGMQDRYRNPDTQKAFAESWDMNPYMATNFADGTKISFEQSCVANATGMKVAQRGMLGYASTDHVDNLTHLFDVDKLKEIGGIVDYIVGAQPSPGVFIYATTGDPVSKKYLKYGKLGDGPLYSFYAPFHLLFFDIASSIARLIDFDDEVIVPKRGPIVDVVATAKKDLFPGETLDGIGGFATYGLCENNSIVLKDNLLPMGLTEGIKLVKPVKKDQVLTFDDVEIEGSRLIDKLWKEQNEI